MRRPRLPRPLAGLATAACALVPLLAAAPTDAQQSTTPDVCPGGEMRGPEGECVPGTGMGGSAPGAAGSTVPDMRGTWQVQSTVIVAGGGQHHPAGAPATQAGGDARLRDFTGTIRIAGQEGERFWGIIESPAYQEDLIGTFTGEGGGRFLAVDADGFYEGSVAEPGRLRFCYRHVTATSRVVCCGTAARG
jgi:hypothetical protein